MTTEGELFRAGLNAFDQSGIEKVRVRDIYEAAGISNGSFFHLFKSKEEFAAKLYLKILTRYHEALLEPLEHPVLAGKFPGCSQLIDAHLHCCKSKPVQARYLLSYPGAHWLGLVGDELESEREQFQEKVGKWHDKLVRDLILQELPVSVFLHQLLGPIQSLSLEWLSRDKFKVDEDQVHILKEAAFYALHAPKLNLVGSRKQ